MNPLIKITPPKEGATYKKSTPFVGKVLSVRALTDSGSDDDVMHVVISLAGSGIKYAEGESMGVIPPGVRDNGKPNPPRLYSIASARNGDEGFSESVSFCVKRSNFTDPQTGASYQGLCSNYLCDIRPDDSVTLTSPTSGSFLLPDDENTDLILIATGTGIAPYRAFFAELKARGVEWKGKVLLFFGAKTKKEALYMNSADNSLFDMAPKGTQIFSAFSREEKTADGNKVYVQHRLMEQRDLIWESLEKGTASFYLCGLKGMEKGAEELLQQYADYKGLELKDFKKQLRTAGRWNVEVY